MTMNSPRRNTDSTVMAVLVHNFGGTGVSSRFGSVRANKNCKASMSDHKKSTVRGYLRGVA